MKARWSFDADRVVEFVTEEDASHVDHLRKQRPRSSHDWARLGSWHDWRVLDIREESLGVAFARVEVWRPARLDRLEADRSRVDAHVSKLRVLLDDPKRLEELRPRLEDAILPARATWILDYRLVETPAGWRVHTGWRDFPEFFRTKDLGRGIRAPRSWEEFEGSEKMLVRRHQEAETKREAFRKSVSARNLDASLRKAEKHVRGRNYRRALEVYDELVVDTEAPDFVRHRHGAVGAERDRWNAVSAGLTATVGEPRATSAKEAEITVELRNTGTETFSAVSVAFEHAFGRAVRTQIGQVPFRDVAPGSTQSHTVSLYAGVRVQHSWLSHLSTGDPLANTRRLPPPRSVEFGWARGAHSSGAPAPASWLLDVVSSQELELDACPEWPDELVRAVVHVDDMGRVVEVELEAREGAFVECAKGLLAAPVFPAGLEPWTADIRLIPRHYAEVVKGW